MNEDQVREASASIGDALVSGDVGRVIETLSDELRRSPGEIVAMLPVPARAVTIGSIESSGGGAAYVVLLEVGTESEHVELELRWKDRGGEPRIVEVSHRSRRAIEAEAMAAAEAEAAAAAEAAETSATPPTTTGTEAPAGAGVEQG